MTGATRNDKAALKYMMKLEKSVLSRCSLERRVAILLVSALGCPGGSLRVRQSVSDPRTGGGHQLISE